MEIDVKQVVRMGRQQKHDALVLLMEDSPIEKTVFLHEVIGGLSDESRAAWAAAFAAYPEIA